MIHKDLTQLKPRSYITYSQKHPQEDDSDTKLKSSAHIRKNFYSFNSMILGEKRFTAK